MPTFMLTQPNAPFSFYDPTRPIYTHERFLPPSRLLEFRFSQRARRRGQLT